MEMMGDKISARKKMIEAVVSCCAWHRKGLASVEEALEVSRRIGFPVMLKASMGGGGKGIRLIKTERRGKGSLFECKVGISFFF
jgi:acetyl-CoA carboxylase biotin carboxylase subunit